MVKAAHVALLLLGLAPVATSCRPAAHADQPPVLPCDVDALTLLGSHENAAKGHRAIIVRVMNKGPLVCSLSGFPLVEMLSPHDEPVAQLVVRNIRSGYLVTPRTEKDVRLAPLQRAQFDVTFFEEGPPGGCLLGRHLEFRLPEQPRAFAIIQRDVRACQGVVHVTPWQRPG